LLFSPDNIEHLAEFRCIKKEKSSQTDPSHFLTETLTVHVIPELSSEKVDYEALIAQSFTGVDDAHSLFVLVDGLAKRIGSLIDSLYVNFDAQSKYIGGGAGSLSFEQNHACSLIKACLWMRQ
jgi:hypothetical protein